MAFAIIFISRWRYWQLSLLAIVFTGYRLYWLSSLLAMLTFTLTYILTLTGATGLAHYLWRRGVIWAEKRVP
ncbi:hypothetical protein FF32_16920 [Halomonas campaniensis]|nr:hypothetical protein FF32_16920 [Halomonas campaniensis]